MKKLHVYKGTYKTGKTEKLLEKMKEIHNKNGPDSYIFLGVSGGHVRTVRERFLEKVGSIFNDQFRVIDQYVVEKVSNIIMDKTHVSSDFIAAIASDLVSDESVLGELMKKGNGISDAFLKFYSMVKEHDKENSIAEYENLDNSMIKEFAGIYRKFQKEFESLNLFSTQDAYNYFSSTIRDGRKSDIEIEEKSLFIDGFLDLSPILVNLFTNMGMLFDDVYITIPLNLNGEFSDASFADLFFQFKTYNPNLEIIEEIFDVCDENRDYVQRYFDCVEKEEKIDKSEFEEIGVEFSESRNLYEEAYHIGSYIKHKIMVEGYSPDEIAVVIRDNRKYGEIVSRILEDMEIPYRFDGNEMILNSINVNRLILPFKAFYSGFSPEYLLAMIESGYTNMFDLSIEDFKSVASGSNIFDAKKILLGIKEWPKTLKYRKKEWEDKLERYKKFLERKKDFSENSVDSEDVTKSIIEQLERTVTANDIVKNLFDHLELCFSSNESRDTSEFEEYFEKNLEILESANMISHDESEVNALKTFFEKVIPDLARLISYTRSSKEGKINPLRYWNYLRILLDMNSYQISSLIDNRILIMDLENARFRNKNIKIFMGMTDKYYPKIELNSFLFELPLTENNLKDILVERDFRNFVYAARNTNQKILFSRPLAETSGKPIFPSSYLKRLFDVRNDDGVCEKIDVDLLNPESYSKNSFIKKLINDNLISWDNSETKYLFDKLGIDFDRVKMQRKTLRNNMESSFSINTSDSEIDKNFKLLFGDTLSASKYKTIRDCGKKTFFQVIMKVYPEFSIDYGFTPLEKGSILHAVLYRMFKYLSERNVLLENMNEIEIGSFLQKEVLDFIKREVTGRIYHQSEVVLNLEYNSIFSTITDFVMNYASTGAKNNPGKYKNSFYSDVQFFPYEFEVPIDRKDKITLYKNPEIYLIGKIDRVDRSESGYEFIIDYKSSDTSARKSKLQLFLYALARMQGKNEGDLAGMTFMSLKTTSKSVAKQFYIYNPEKKKYVYSRGRDEFKELSLPEFENILKNDLDNIFEGKLDYTNDVSDCENCEFKRNGSCSLRNFHIEVNE